MNSEITITWHGHSCFSLAAGGYTLVLDPYDNSLDGYAPLQLSANEVLCSHGHHDHARRFPAGYNCRLTLSGPYCPHLARRLPWEQAGRKSDPRHPRFRQNTGPLRRSGASSDQRANRANRGLRCPDGTDWRILHHRRCAGSPCRGTAFGQCRDPYALSFWRIRDSRHRRSGGFSFPRG